jgi:AMIN domain
MSHLSYIGALLTAAALLSAPVSVSAQKAVPSPAAGSSRVQHVNVRESGDDMEVEIQLSGAPVAPNTQAITGPDRIVVDFPGALPAAGLGALKVNQGALKGIRSGLFFDNPPITRIVLDLVEAQPYTISTSQNTVIVTLGHAGAVAAHSHAPSGATLQSASLASGVVAPSKKTLARVSATVANATQTLPRVTAPPALPLTVTYANGMLRIQAQKVTLSQVLFEVQRQTQAEIAIPAGAEQEEVAADLGPASAREVLTSLLNGSPYNFIFVGNELSLERVILSRRDPSSF